MSIPGVDYAWSHPSPAALKSRGIQFACRYGGAGIDDSKMISAGEAARLTSAGIAIVANVEGSAGGFRGYSAGQSFARRGRAWFRNLGMPDNRPIYYSADWDVQPGDWPDLKAALDGAANVDGRNNVGLYGGRYAIQKAMSTGSAKWFWQTYGWSGSPIQWVNGVHIQQYRNGVTIDGADCDLDRAMVADFGQWGADVVLTQDDINAIAQAVGNLRIGNKAYPGRTLLAAINDLSTERDMVVDPLIGLKNLDPRTPLAQLLSTPATLKTVASLASSIQSGVTALAQQPQVEVSKELLAAAFVQALEQLAAQPTPTAKAADKED